MSDMDHLREKADLVGPGFHVREVLHEPPAASSARGIRNVILFTAVDVSSQFLVM
jgi:hypothetical protein